MSATSSSPLRSALPHHASSSNAALSTVKALREGHAESVRTSDAPALPFVVTRHFISNSERYQLFPGAFPDVEEDLGRGASFVVQCARLPDRTNVSSGKNISVALKRIRPGRNSSRTRQSFQEIIADLICLSHQPLHQHPNVVTLLGLGWELSPSTSDSRLWPYLILEYAVHGTLADFQNSGKILPYAEKKKIALDIADGLGAVHYSNIIHGDIKSENILLFEDPEEGLIAKLSDFGYATLNIDFSGSQSSINDEPEEVLVKSGTIPWTAPEYGKVVPWEHAFKSDVYSWGLLVWRIFIDGANPFRAHQQLFEELGGNRDHLETPNVLQWKSADVVQAAAKKFASTVRQPAGEYRLEKVFEWSLKLKPQERDLLRASLSWRFGPQGLSAQYPFKLPLSRQLLFTGSDSHHGFLGQAFSFPQFQMLPPRLREQFLEDLKIMARLESPLPEDEAHLCPTVTAAMILAEYNISHDELGFAYDYIVQAASKGLLFARALASRLEPYKNSQMKEFTSGKFRMHLTSHRDIEQPDISNKISSWLYEAAALGSVSALEHLKPNKSKYTNALRTLRTCRVGGFQHLSMWTVLDATYSRQEGYLVAGPIGGDEITAKIILDKHDEDHCRWINAGPRIGSEISFLHVACAKGLREAVDVVLKRGAPVNSKFCPGDETPLLLACMSGSSETVKRLLKHGANPCMSDNDGETPLHWLSAFDADDIPTIAGLLYRRKAQLSASAKGSVMLSEGYFLELAFASGTPLHRAVGKRNIHAVRALLDLGADPLAVDDRQHTPFGLAAMFHLAEILKLLHSRVPNYKPNQDHGPDLRLFNFAINSASPLQQFNVHGVKWYDEMKNTLQTLLDFGESLYGYNGEDNFIRNAIAVGNLKMVEFLLANGASEHVNKFDYSGCGFPALYHALELGHQRIFTTLLNHGADVESLFVPEKMRQPGTKILLDNRPDRSTYLHVCAEMGADTWFVREFLRRGVPINQQDANWQTALYLAIKAGYTGIATVLIEYGANLKEILDGKTILGQLATEGFGVSKDRFQFLLGKLPASPAAKLLTGPRDRQSIFHHFAQDGRVIRQPAWARELLQFFIDQIGDRRLLDLQDTAMNTALHLAVQHGNTEVARALLEAKANCNLRSNEGFTPLALANNLRAPGYKDVVALLQAHGAVAEKKEADTVDVNTAKALWMELGFPEKDDEWLDTALVHVLQQLQQDLLTLFREDGFLISENSWKSATQVVWDCVSTNTAIVEKKERIADFEYATGQMLHGFVDLVSVKLQENDGLLVKLVKPFNKRERKFPPGLLNPQITLSARTPGVGMTSYFQSDSEAVALGIRPKKSEDPEQKPEKSSASPDKINDGGSKETLIRIRQLDEGRFVIERHEPGEEIDEDTGTLYVGPGSSFAQEIFGASLDSG